MHNALDTLRISRLNNGMIFKCSRFSDAEMLEINRYTHAQPDLEHLDFSLLDLSDVERSEITIPGVRLNAELDARNLARNPDFRIAAVASGPVYLGFANVYRAYFEHANPEQQWPIVVFKTLPDAWEWLGVIHHENSGEQPANSMRQ